MRPVSSEFRTSQHFGSGATAGVVANPSPDSGMGYYVWLYGNYQPRGHAGMDIACPVGTPIYAPDDGTVLYAGWTEDLPGSGDIRKWLFYYNFGGILTVIQHNGWISAIAHQSNNDAVRPGMRVTEGQLIGKSGNTKTRTTKVAPHVHIEALVDLTYRTGGGLIYGRTNPEPFFGTGLAAAGSITPQSNTNTSEEDDMPTLDEIWSHPIEDPNEPGKFIPAYEWVRQGNIKAGRAAAAAEAIPAAVLYNERVDGRNLFDWLKQLRADVVGIQPGSVDVAGIAKALAEQLPQSDAEALVDALAARLGGK